jgi:hypothetical protein
MHHVRVALYEITSGTIDEVTSQAERELLPIFRVHPGFVSFGLATVSDFKLLSLSVWETRDQADAMDTRAADWVLEALGNRVKLAESHVGHFVFLEVPLPISARSDTTTAP